MKTWVHRGTISLLCPACDRELAVANVADDGQISYRVPTRPGAAIVTLEEIPPAFGGVATSIAEIPAVLGPMLEWDGTPDHRRLRFREHHRCRATLELREETLKALVRASADVGLERVHLGRVASGKTDPRS